MLVSRGIFRRFFNLKNHLKLTRFSCCESEDTKSKLLCKLEEPTAVSANKVTVVGCGSVGMANIIAILASGTTTHMALVDMNENKLIGERMDLEHGSLWLRDAKIEASKDYAVSAGSKVCVLCAGVRQKEGESRLNLVSRNVEVFKKIIPNLVKHSPDAVIVVVANPVDILTYCAWKLSGLPKNRVIGSGCSLDSSRFRFFISQKLGVSPSVVEGWIIGEHGDSSVACWSGVNVAGVRLMDLNPKIGTKEDPENWEKCHKDVVQSAYDIIKLKGYTNWGISLCVFPIVNAILKNSGECHPVTCNVIGQHCVERDIFMSLPCILGQRGVVQIVRHILTDTEQAKFTESAKILSKVADDIKW